MPEEPSGFLVHDRRSMQKTEIIEKPTKNILVIDDDKLVLKTIAKYLKNCGYLVTIASSGLEALDKIDTLPGIPDLIISDIRMPGISGIETLRQIRERIRNNNKTINVSNNNYNNYNINCNRMNNH